MATPFVRLWNEKAYHRREAVARRAAEDICDLVEDDRYKPTTEDILFLIRESEQASEHIRIEAIRALAILIEGDIDDGCLVTSLDDKKLQLALFKSWTNNGSLRIKYAAVEYAWIIYLHEAIPYIREFMEEFSEINQRFLKRAINILCGAMVREYRDKIVKGREI